MNPAQCDGRCRRAGAEVGQCRHPARRIGFHPFGRRHSGGDERGPEATAGLPEEPRSRVVNSTDRAAVGLMLEGLNGAVDLIIPRAAARGLTGPGDQ